MANVMKSQAAIAGPTCRSGRPPGSRNKISKAQILGALESGDLMPLDYILAIMRDDGLPTRSDRRPGRLAASLARSATTHAAATHIAQHEEWAFLLVRYTLIADVWHDLGTGTDAAGIYRDAVLGSHRLLDLMLGRLLELGSGPINFLADWRIA